MNGNRSYDPRSASLPGVERKRPALKIVAGTDLKVKPA